MIAASIDTRGLQFVINGMQNALLGTGGDCSTILKDESRLLALEISKRMGPKDRSKTNARIDKSVRSVFLGLDADTDFEGHSGKEGNSGVKWYSSDKDFLFGVARDSDMRHADPQTMANIYYHAKTVAGKKRIVVDFKNPHQHQRISISTRIITSKSVLRKTITIVQKSVGKLKASWFADAMKIDPQASLVPPNWIAQHIRGNETTKSITDLSAANSPDSPAIGFGSRAAGVKSFERPIQYAVSLRREKVSARLRLVLSGYSKDVAAGIRPHHHAKESHES